MNNKSRTKSILTHMFTFLKPLIIASLLIGGLQVSGLMSSVSYGSRWALLQTGLWDATPANGIESETFDYGFQIKDLQGTKLSFDQFKNKVVFLNLWATWCGPCRAEMPGIQKLFDKIDNEKITFIMLSLDKDSDLGKVSDYMKKNKFTFHAYMPSGYLPSQLQVPTIPTTFIISKDGKIIQKEIGSMQYDTSKFQQFLEDLSK